MLLNRVSQINTRTINQHLRRQSSNGLRAMQKKSKCVVKGDGRRRDSMSFRESDPCQSKLTLGMWAPVSKRYMNAQYWSRSYQNAYDGKITVLNILFRVWWIRWFVYVALMLYFLSFVFTTVWLGVFLILDYTFETVTCNTTSHTHIYILKPKPWMELCTTLWPLPPRHA